MIRLLFGLLSAIVRETQDKNIIFGIITFTFMCYCEEQNVQVVNTNMINQYDTINAIFRIKTIQTLFFSNTNPNRLY